MRRHTLIGERIVAAAPALRRGRARSCAPATSAYDGSGYPDGLRGDGDPAGRAHHRRLRRLRRDVDRPPLPARDLARATRSPSCVAARGTQFDPAVVEAFCSALEASDGRRLRSVA